MAAPAARTVRVRVPATSANLGPGFDAFGLALALQDDVRVRVEGDGARVEVSGEGAGEVPCDERHLVVQAMHRAFERMGVPAPGLRLRCANRIPHGRGLGSSAAAIVAGILAARGVVADGARRLDDAAVLDLASALEGHPDNVAACLLGGLTLAWTEGAAARAVRLPVHRSVVPVVLVPAERSATTVTRGLLPATVPHADAAANSARAALLVEAFGRRPGLLLTATEDRLHQRYRTDAMPASMALVERLRAEGVPAVLSGAGPSVLALTDAEAAAGVAARAGQGWQALRLAVAPRGARVLRGAVGE